MREAAIRRMERVGPVALVVACDALVARLRRIHRAARDASAAPEEIRAAHTENAEALLNLLSVLAADGSQAEAHARLSRDLDSCLSGAKSLGFRP